MQDFRLQPKYTLGFPSSGMLRSLYLYLLIADVGQLFCLLDWSTLEDGWLGSPETSVYNYFFV